LRTICERLVEHDPRQLKFPFALWTAKMVQHMIGRDFGVGLSKASVCRLLKQLGLTPQRPLWRAWQQNPQRVAHWLSVEFPKLRRAARRAGATIFFGDEAGVKSTAHAGTTWAPKGQTPVLRTTGARFGLNILSAISARGDLRFMLRKGTVNGDVFITFLKRLVYGAKSSIYLIVDGHPSHKTKKVKKFVAGMKGKLELVILPGYSPEINPDEFVWNELKTHGLSRMTVTDPDDLTRKVLSLLRQLQRNPKKVASFFQAKDTQYAA
jgi:transposase